MYARIEVRAFLFVNASYHSFSATHRHHFTGFFMSHPFCSVNLNNLDVFVYLLNRTSPLRFDVFLSQLSHLLPNNQIIIGPANVTAVIPNNTQPSDLDSLFISVSIICFSVNMSSRCSLLPVRMNLVLDSSRIFSSLIIFASSLIYSPRI